MTKRIVERLIRESNGSSMTAEIFANDGDELGVDYFINGDPIKTELFHGRSRHYVESAVENWFNGIKVLNG